MSEPIVIAKEITAKLCMRRISSLENELCEVFRNLSKQHQLEVIFELLQNNVRLAATIAARGQICRAQQSQLLHFLLKSNKTNSLKVMICDVFAHRMKASVFARLLEEHRSKYPTSVFLAAYYFLGAAEMSSKNRSLLRALLEATRPKACES